MHSKAAVAQQATGLGRIGSAKCIIPTDMASNGAVDSMAPSARFTELAAFLAEISVEFEEVSAELAEEA